MRRSVKAALDELSSNLASLRDKFPELTKEEQIDVGAHIRAAMRICEGLDKQLKELVASNLDGVGIVKGENFNAIRIYVDGERLDAKALKESHPIIYSKYLVDNGYYRINFEIK